MQITVNGKTKRVDEKDLIRIEKGLNVSREKALQIYLEDEKVLINNEQEELDNKAKQADITRIIHDAISEKVVQKRMSNTIEKKKTVKPQPDKEHILNMIRVILEGHQNADNVVIENPTKIITFTYNGNPYKIDLTATRVKK